MGEFLPHEVLGRALRAAVQDRRKELDGIELVYFADADLVAGALFARSELEKDIRRQFPITRSIVRALWVDDALPTVRLTLPHLEEVRGLLRRIRESGGIEAFIKTRTEHGRGDQFAMYTPEQQALGELLEAVRTGETGLTVDLSLMQKLTLPAFAALEAEIAFQRLREPGFLARLIDLDGELGEDADQLKAHELHDTLVAELHRLRGRHSTDPASSTDVCSLLAVSRLWSQVAAEGRRLEFRFYTQTDPVRELCDVVPHGLTLLTQPGAVRDPQDPALDSAVTGLRSSTYLILRAIFSSLSPKQPLDTEGGRELDALDAVATSLVRDSAVKGRSEGMPASLSRLMASTSEELASLTKDLQQHTFVTRLMERGSNSRVLNTLHKLHDERLHAIQRVLVDPPTAFRQQADDAIRELEGRIGLALGLRSAVALVARLPQVMWPFPPRPGSVDAAIARWQVPGTSAGEHVSISNAQALRAVLGSTGQESIDAIQHLIAKAESKDHQDVLSASAALLVIGASDLACRMLQPLVGPRVPNTIRVAAMALQVWGYATATSLDWSKVRRTWKSLREVTEPTGMPLYPLSFAWATYYAAAAIGSKAQAASLAREMVRDAIPPSMRAIQDAPAGTLARHLAFAANLLLWCEDIRLSENRDSVISLAGALERYSSEPDPASDLYSADAVRWANIVLWRRSTERQYAVEGLDPDRPWEVLEPYQARHASDARQAED